LYNPDIVGEVDKLWLGDDGKNPEYDYHHHRLHQGKACELSDSGAGTFELVGKI